MTTLTIPKSAEPSIWARIWRGLRAVDEAVHHDPTDALQRRIECLELRFEDLEADVHAGAH